MHSLRGRVKTMLLLVLMALMLHTSASAAELETVRVGFFYLEDYHEIGANGVKDGYGYALMQLIRRYADVEFEYIGYDKTWADMLRMLEDGEIDVLSDATITPERQEKFLYSDIPIGTCDVILSVKAGNSEMRQGNYASYDGKTIGFVYGIAENDTFAAFAREKGFTYDPEYFGTTRELAEALQTGMVDAIVYSDFRTSSDEWIVERIPAEDVYLMVSKDNAELMEVFNEALRRMEVSEIGWRGELKNTYCPYSGSTTVYFTVEEQESLQQFKDAKRILTVMALPDNPPYSWYETDENGAVVAGGVRNNFFQRAAQILGIEYRYVVPKNYSDYMSMLRNGAVDIVLDQPRNFSRMETYGYLQTPCYDKLSVARVYTKGLTGDIQVIGCLESMPYLADELLEENQNLQVVTFKSIDEASTALKNGSVDYFYCLEHTAKVMINQDERVQLRYAVIGDDRYEFCLTVSNRIDREIVSAICTVVSHSGARIIQDIYDDNINFGVNQTPGLMAALYNDPVPVVTIGAVIVIIVCFSLLCALYFSRRERETVLRAEIENNALLKTMYAAMPFGLLRLEISGENFNITYANRHFYTLVGAKDLEEANKNYENGLGKGLLDRDRFDVRTMYDRLREVGDSAVAESRARLPGGEIRWIRCSSTLVDMVGKTRIVQQLILDITEEREAQARKERERADEAINQMFGTLTRSATDIYILYSLEQHKVRFISPNTEQRLGVPLEDAYEDINIFLRAEIEGDSGITEEKLESLKKGDNLLGEVKRVHLKTGEIRWYRDEVYYSNIGGERHLIVVMSDITQERKESEALQMALVNAENASKAKTDFLSNMSHDIRTPMNTIVGLINLLKTDSHDDEKAAHHLDGLDIAANNMMEIINNVLDMSRIENGTNTLNEAPFCLRDVLADVESISSTQARVKELRVRSRIELEGEMYVGDALRLKQILMNLVSNAVKYTQEGGGIDLYARDLRRVPGGRSMIRFVISDTGIGMSEEFQRELFSPFARERNTTISGIVGTGLGMSIVKNMVDLMGGSINVKSAVGEGTTFTVDIPLRMVENEAAASEDQDTDDPSISGVRMLVAEDNELNAEILMELLRREGAVCEWAENGQVVVDRFLAAPEDSFDVILMDIQMPVMDGYAAAKMIRASSHPQAKTIPISAMTANAFTEDITNALAAGMNAHIAKPVDMKVLKATVTKLVREKG